MSVKIHYRITQDRAGLPQNYCGARRFVPEDGVALEDTARSLLAADYQVPASTIEICRIEN